MVPELVNPKWTDPIVNVIKQIASCTTLGGPTGAGLDILIDSLLMPNANNLREAEHNFMALMFPLI